MIPSQHIATGYHKIYSDCIRSVLQLEGDIMRANHTDITLYRETAYPRPSRLKRAVLDKTGFSGWKDGLKHLPDFNLQDIWC